VTGQYSNQTELFPRAKYKIYFCKNFVLKFSSFLVVFEKDFVLKVCHKG
jgi:hypothetical protein